MKKIIVLLVACTLSAGVFAQAANHGQMHNTAHSMKMGKSDMKMKDCVMMEEGKMMVMQSGKTMDMDKDMTMKNGTMVMKDGTVKMKNGKTAMLKDGECVYMSGRMSKMKMMKNSMKDKM